MRFCSVSSGVVRRPRVCFSMIDQLLTTRSEELNTGKRQRWHTHTHTHTHTGTINWCRSTLAVLISVVIDEYIDWSVISDALCVRDVTSDVMCAQVTLPLLWFLPCQGHVTTHSYGQKKSFHGNPFSPQKIIFRGEEVKQCCLFRRACFNCCRIISCAKKVR